MHKEKHCTLCLPCLKGGGPAHAGGGIHTLAYKDTLLLRSNVGDRRIAGGGIQNNAKFKCRINVENR